MQVGHDKAAHFKSIRMLKNWATRAGLYSTSQDRAKIVPCLLVEMRQMPARTVLVATGLMAF